LDVSRTQRLTCERTARHQNILHDDVLLQQKWSCIAEIRRSCRRVAALRNPNPVCSEGSRTNQRRADQYEQTVRGLRNTRHSNPPIADPEVIEPLRRTRQRRDHAMYYTELTR